MSAKFHVSTFHVSISHVRIIDAKHVAVFQGKRFYYLLTSSDMTEVHDARVYVCCMLEHG